jgi:hypothetical protein
VCKHLNQAFEAMLEYHAAARTRYEEAVACFSTAEASVLEVELASSSEPIRRAVQELREHEATHTRQAVKTRHRLLRLVKSAHPKYGTSFLLDRIDKE